MTINEELWFVGKEVCAAIGLANLSNAVKTLAPDQHMTVTKSTNSNLFTFGRGSSRLVLISESGLYKLAGRSDKPQAAAFQDWVTREVLPSIRKTGSYVAPQVAAQVGLREADETVVTNIADSVRLIDVTVGDLHALIAGRGLGTGEIYPLVH